MTSIKNWPLKFLSPHTHTHTHTHPLNGHLFITHPTHSLTISPPSSKEQYYQKTKEYWKRQTEIALQEVEDLKKKVFFLEKEIERDKGKEYLVEFLNSCRESSSLPKVCLLACLRS